MLDKSGEFCVYKSCLHPATHGGYCRTHTDVIYDPFTKEYRMKTSKSITAPAVAMKHDDNKIRMELLSPIALTEIAKVLTFGAKKYDSHNWRKGFAWSRLLGATLRHLLSFIGGEDKDPETGLSHLSHAGCCIMFLLEHEVTHKGKDDRYKSPEQTCDNDNEGDGNGF